MNREENHKAHFEAAAASVIGQMHRRRGRGGQDGHSTATGTGWAVAAVADGVSASGGSEIGARLAARWVAAAAARELAAGRDVATVADISRWFDALTRRMASLAHDLSWPGEAPIYAIADFFLFTLQIAVVDRVRYCVAGVGDGIVGVDGRFVVLEPEASAGPGGSAGVVGPSCPMYARVDAEDLDHPIDTTVRLHLEGDRADFRRLVVATDGCLDFIDSGRRTDERTPLALLVDEPDVVWRPARLQAQLEHLCARNGWPQDDATVAVIGAMR